ncbi:lipid II flippase MurJ [Streptomyces sp. FXJ1.172]|uniref:murein biosynthesis integral membrane protein MurJ n=1 Tax=Streptomyces sp. FXJ1.172 TaxID=710705 RepID=UPI001F378C78|nr:lipid II flippase MurJ [Streptomyces sp. FXJ1.172]WEO97329.1 lipid II flippase MurJ [Streptomyces sp. FXJ1.172]
MAPTESDPATPAEPGPAPHTKPGPPAAPAEPGPTPQPEPSPEPHAKPVPAAPAGSGSVITSSDARSAPSTTPDPAPLTPPDHHRPPTRRFLARAAVVTASLSVVGALLGLVRDQSLARLFGAGQDTDAFLVAWTLPEFAATLLIEDGLAFALIPAFSRALARRAQGAAGDPVRALVAGTLPRLALAFAAVGGLLALAAPQFVAALAPGLPDPGLAVDCTRLTATCVLSFGLAGYCSAALRAHRRFLAPAAIYIAYNLGIVTAMYALGGHWGVRSAAVGVAAGGCLMVGVQLPFLVSGLRRRRTAAAGPAAVAGPGALDVPLMATVLLFALCRQSQVLIERFLASGLPAGAISHLNYAQKVAQIPMTLSMMLCTVTFPVVARALAEGHTERARARVERDLAVAAGLVLLGAATVVACAPQLIGLLFQRGAFTAQDTAATAEVMRVYALGLLGQTLTGVLVRSYFSAGRATWYPVGAMAAGIAVTSWIGAWSLGSWGVTGIAAANATGITVTAALLLAGMGRRSVPVRVPRMLRELSRPVRAAAVAALAGGFAARLPASPLAGLAAGGATVTVVFVLLGRALGDLGCAAALCTVRTLTRRLAHALLR